MEPDAVEIRVIGCLVEKQRTTPDASFTAPASW